MNTFFYQFARPNYLYEQVSRGILLLMLVGTIASCTSQEPLNEEEVENAFRTQGYITLSKETMDRLAIQMEKPMQRKLSEKLPFRGYIEVPPENLHSIHAPVRGLVSEGLLIEGDIVKKGQVLIKIKHPDIVKVQEDYAKLMAELNFMEKELDRQQQLARNEAASQKRVDEVFRDLSLLRASKDALESRLKMLSILPEAVLQGTISEEIVLRSPANGSITKIAYNAGKLVAEDEFLLEIVDKHHLHLAMDIYEDQSSFIQKGQVIEFFVPGNTQTHRADLVLIGQMVDPVKRTVLVHAHPQEDLEIFVPGMQVQGNVLLDEQEYLCIPAASVFSTEDGTHLVFVAEPDGKFTWKELGEVKILDDYAILSPEDIGLEVVGEGAWYLFGLWNQ
jgi:cobalt-zinc-cadmium efflux system membrane fusion protein